MVPGIKIESVIETVLQNSLYAVLIEDLYFPADDKGRFKLFWMMGQW